MDCREAEHMHDDLPPQPARQTREMASHPMEQRVDMALRSAFMVEAPADLTARLLAITAPAPQMSRFDRALQQALIVPVPPDLSRRLELLVATHPVVAPVRSRWMWAAYALAALVLGVVLVIAAQGYGLAMQQLGVPELWTDMWRTPQQWLAEFYAVFPQGRYLVDAFVMLQNALQWVLLGLIIWMVLELRSPQRQHVATRWN